MDFIEQTKEAIAVYLFLNKGFYHKNVDAANNTKLERAKKNFVD